MFPEISREEYRALRGDPRRWHDAIAAIAARNQSSPCGGSCAGANVVGVHGSPSAARTARARVESTTTAITLRRPPHGHDGTSVANTRRNSSAHRTRPAELEHQVGAAIVGRRVNGGAEGLGAYDPSSRREAAEGGGSDAGKVGARTRSSGSGLRAQQDAAGKSAFARCSHGSHGV